jgi:hypothetical protein
MQFGTEQGFQDRDVVSELSIQDEESTRMKRLRGRLHGPDLQLNPDLIRIRSILIANCPIDSNRGLLPIKAS